MITTRSSLSYDGTKIQYLLSSSSGPPLLLIHGYPQTSYAWRKVVAPLDDAGFRLIIPDLRGAGGSGRPEAGYDKLSLAGDCAAVLADAGVDEPLIVVGHDIGSMVAYAFCQRYRDRVAGLVVLDAPLPGTEVFDNVRREGAKVWHFHFHQALDIPEALTAGREAFYLERFYHDLAYDASAISVDDLAVYVRAYSQPGAMRAGFNWYRAFEKDVGDNRRLLKERGKLTIPVLAIGSEFGRYAKLIGAMMSEVAERVEVAVVPRAGHWIVEENPTDFANELIRFARSLSGIGASPRSAGGS